MMGDLDRRDGEPPYLNILTESRRRNRFSLTENECRTHVEPVPEDVGGADREHREVRRAAHGDRARALEAAGVGGVDGRRGERLGGRQPRPVDRAPPGRTASTRPTCSGEQSVPRATGTPASIISRPGLLRSGEEANAVSGSRTAVTPGAGESFAVGRAGLRAGGPRTSLPDGPRGGRRPRGRTRPRGPSPRARAGTPPGEAAPTGAP